MYLIQQRVVSVSMRTGTPEITPELTRTIAEGVMREATDRSVEQLAEAENEILMGLLRLRTEHDVYPQNA